MIDVHKRLHAIATDNKVAAKGDAIVPVARELAQDGRILCFDEFQVTDIADGASGPLSSRSKIWAEQITTAAMILRRLLESLIGYGFVIVITSKFVCHIPVGISANIPIAVAGQTTYTRTVFSDPPSYHAYP